MITMDEILAFVIENYIWIIIIGIVIIMTIIGFIADKTEFGKKSLKESKKEKKVKKTKNKKAEPAFETDEMENFNDIPEPKVSASPEVPPFHDVANAKVKEIQPATNIEDNINRLNEFIANDKELEEPMENFFEEDTHTNKEEVFNKEEEMEEPVLEQSTNNEPLDSAFTFDDRNTNQEVEETNPSTETTNELEEISEIELPSIESLDKELDDYEEEDDVWKF